MSSRIGWCAMGMALALGGCAPADPVQTTNLYERADALSRQKGFDARMAQSAARLAEMRWMIGDWRTEVTVFRTSKTPERRVVETSRFRQHGDTVIADEALSTIIGFDPFEGRWLNSGLELPAAASTGGYADWDGRRMVLTPKVRIFGETYRLRQTLTRTGPDSFEVFNEQQVGGGRYAPLDRYRYVRIRPPAGVNPAAAAGTAPTPAARRGSPA